MKSEPYVGPRPFTLEDRDRFFGRKDDTDEAVSLVMAHPVVLIYALSGVGKSSLVNAGVVPLLREEGYAVLPPARVEGVLPEGIDPTSLTNAYVFHALACWLDVQEVPFCAAEEVTGLRLTEFLDRWMKARPRTSDDATPVLVFDQFEEIFTVNEGRWKERENFFAQVGEALRQHPALKIVFTLREEFIARLEPFAKYFPRQLRIRNRLERLREPGALSAITLPVKSFGVQFAEGVAEKLAHDLLGLSAGAEGGEVRGEFIEPVQLQVVCRNLWEKLPDDFKQPSATGEPRLITLAHLEAAGEVTTALSNYYNEAIHAAVQASGVREGPLRRWLGETLIASDHSSLGLAVKGQGDTAAIPERAIRVLQERYLIRHEKRGMTEWYELSHARFIEPILRSNAAWLKERGGAEVICEELERRAVALNRTGESLEEWELGHAENFLKSPEAAELGDHSAIEALVRRSREFLLQKKEAEARELKQQAVAKLQAQRLADREKAIRWHRVLLGGLAIMTVLAFIGHWKAFHSYKTAKARELAFRALDDIRRDPERALLLAQHSFFESPTSEGINVLHQTLAASPIRLRLAGKNGHVGSVTACAYSPDGGTIVTGGLDGRVRLWNAAHQDEPTFVGAGEEANPPLIWSVAFSPDGRTLAVARKDGKVLLWPYPAPPDGRWPAPRILPHLHQTTGDPVEVRCVAFDPSGVRLITSCHDGTARVWDLAEGRELLRLIGHQDYVRSAAFSPSENLAVTAGMDGKACVWDLSSPPEPGASGPPTLRTPRNIYTFTSEGDTDLWDAQFSPDGSRIVTAGADHVARIWDVASAMQIATLDNRLGAAIFQAKFIDASQVVTVSGDKTARIWRLEAAPQTGFPDSTAAGTPPGIAPVTTQILTGTTVAVIRGHTDFVRSVAIRPDHREMVTASRDGTARVWTLFSGTEVAAAPAATPFNPVWSAAYSPEGGHLAVASSRTVEIWATDAFGKENAAVRLPEQPAPLRHVCYSPDGRRLATADRDGHAKIWDAATGHELVAVAGVFYTVAFHPDGLRLAGASDGNVALVTNLYHHTSTRLEGHEDKLMSVAFSRDGSHLVTSSLDDHVKVWSVETNQVIADYSLVNSDIGIDAAFSPDGNRVVIAWGDGRASVWDWTATADGKPRVSEIKANEGQVRRVLFFRSRPFDPVNAAEKRDGRPGIITAGFDGAVRAWQEDLTSHQWSPAFELPGATGPVYALTVTPDGTRIFAGGADRTGRVYYTDSDWLCDLAKQRVTRKLTDEEYRNFGIEKKKDAESPRR